MQKVTSSDQKYRSQRKEKMLFKSLSNTLMRKKFKKLVFGGLRDVKYFFWTNHFFLAFSSLIFLQFSMPKQGVKNCLFLTSSDQKYRSQRKEKILFKLLSNTLMKTNFEKLFLGGLGIFFLIFLAYSTGSL